MTTRRGLLVAAGMTFGVVLLPSASTAQSDGALPAPPPVAEQQWQSVPCGTCQRAGISFDFRQSPNEGREPGAFIIARLRNLTQRELAGSIELMDAELPDSEGHIPSQMLWFVLNPSGSEGGEQTVLLRRRTPVHVIAHNVAPW
jgi:hypothetical protein